MIDSLYELDLEILYWGNSLIGGSSESFWLIVENVFSWLPLYILIVYLYFKNYSRIKAFIASCYFFGAGAVALFLKEVTKRIVERPRPCNVPEIAENLDNIIHCKESFSFFSGHASFAVAMSLFAILSLKQYYKKIYLILIFPFLFIIGRIAGGVHYPSDLIVGILVGALVAYFLNFLFRKEIIKIPGFIAERL